VPVLTAADQADLPVGLRVLNPPAPPPELPRKAVAAACASETHTGQTRQRWLPQPDVTRNINVAAALLAGVAVGAAALFSSYYLALVAGAAALVCAAVALLAAPGKSGAALPGFAALASVLVLGIRLFWPALFGFEAPVARDLT